MSWGLDWTDQRPRIAVYARGESDGRADGGVGGDQPRRREAIGIRRTAASAPSAGRGLWHRTVDDQDRDIAAVQHVPGHAAEEDSGEARPAA